MHAGSVRMSTGVELDGEVSGGSGTVGRGTSPSLTERDYWVNCFLGLILTVLTLSPKVTGAQVPVKDENNLRVRTPGLLRHHKFVDPYNPRYAVPTCL